MPIPRVQATLTADDCRVVGGGGGLQIVKCGTQNQGKHGPPSARPNYISQDDEDQPRGYNTRSGTTSIMQEAMLAMANSVLGENGKLLEYRHLIANPKTRATWTHSYGNELGRLAQGMPSRAQGTDTIFFISRHKRDVNYGLITCLVRPEK